MNKFHVSFLLATFATVLVLPGLGPAFSQEIGLITLNTKEVAKGYRASALKMKPVMNDKGELIGSVDDFIFSKDSKIFVIIDVGDFIGHTGSLVAVPFRNLKLDDPSGMIVVPGASRAALLKLPVFLYNR